MMTSNFLRVCIRFLVSLLMIYFSSVMLFAQTDTIVNQYARVITRSDHQVIVDNASAFHDGDYVLIIQMQGAASLVVDAVGSGTTVEQIVGVPGRYEFLKISTVAGTTINFPSSINKYDPDGIVQILKVPFVNTLSTSKTLTCKPWDRNDKTGGVLAVLVAKDLSLKADINVAGKGFNGGAADLGTGLCAFSSGITDSYNFPLTYQDAGYKGEGVTSHQSLCGTCTPVLLPLLKGQGALLTGGGGGNGRFSGGGGGSNRGKGGLGGLEDNLCSPLFPGGNNGVSVSIASIDTITGGMYMGGGGGSSTALSGYVATPGGNGGGIVIIVTDQLNGNGHKIIADGQNAQTAVGFAGAGGGGGGGTVAISSNSLSNLSVSVNGGNGGGHIDGFGHGGGGGGGLIWISQSSVPGSVTYSSAGGDAGQDVSPNPSTAFPGDPGISRLDFKAQLNGFLFNSIRSSVTGNQTDSICSNTTLPIITGTQPVGGNPGAGYIYLWERSLDQTVWTPVTNDPDPKNYSPPGTENDTVWFRRTITDHSTPAPIVDRSIPVKFIVQTAIAGNTIGKDTTICNGQDPLPFVSTPVPSKGNNFYRYKWLQNTVDNGWDTLHIAAGQITGRGYDPPALNQDTYYKRFVQSGRCIDFSPTAKITVLSSIQNNQILNTPADICYGSVFTNFSGSSSTTSPALSGGDNSYRFSWEASADGATGWTPAAGIITGAGFNPDETAPAFPGSLYYRRIVKSGNSDVCVSFSSAVKINDYPVISNDAIKTSAVNKPICSGSAPPKLTDSLTISGGMGAGTYAYSWEYRSKSQPWTSISGATSFDYQPGVLTDTTEFRRTATSSACSDISNLIKIDVHNPILNNSISLISTGTDSTICNGANPNLLKGTIASGGDRSNYAYLWESSADNSTWTQIPSATLTDFDPPALTRTTYYRRQVISGACTDVSSAIVKITVLPLISNNTVSGKTSVCSSLVPQKITGAAPSGGSGSYIYFWEQSANGGASWSPAALVNNTSDYQPPSLTSPMKYRRNVTSGINNCCTSVSNVFDLSIDPLPTSRIYAGPDTVIYSSVKIYHMKAVDPGLVNNGEKGFWSLLNGGTMSYYTSDTTFRATVSNLNIGKNSFLWTVMKGPCKLTDTVSIELLNDLIPQGFSPNGDDINNTFVIEGMNLDDHYVDLSIVNGTGLEVYRTSNRNKQEFTFWDGKNSAGLDLAEGTYYYMYKISSKVTDKVLFRKKGFILLKRY